MPKKNLARYFAKNFTIVLSLVLIWRGIWYSLDFIDTGFFGTHLYTALGGIILGIILLYLPDKDLKEIEKL
ncbi:MAG: hypothetical protein AAB584_02020 [Patescibacteria group bacterium]